MKFFSTFLAGGGEIVADFLREDFSEVFVDRKNEGLIEYTASLDVEKIRELKYFNNSYLELAVFDAASFPSFINQIIRYLREQQGKIYIRLKEIAGNAPLTYRLMFYDRNQPAGVEETVLTALEKYISGGKLVDRTHPNLEVSAIFRSEGRGYLGIRLTYHPDYKRTLRPGQLRPEVGYILCRLSIPTDRDVFLDPFAGFGSVVEARYQIGQVGKIFCSDKDQEKVNGLKKRFGGIEVIRIRQADATDLTWVSRGSVDRIVTDPPWGSYDKYENINKLYSGMIIEFERVLVRGGKAVVLTGAKKEFDQALEASSSLRLEKKWDVLISGRQAAIYICRSG